MVAEPPGNAKFSKSELPGESDTAGQGVLTRRRGSGGLGVEAGLADGVSTTAAYGLDDLSRELTLCASAPAARKKPLPDVLSTWL